MSLFNKLFLHCSVDKKNCRERAGQRKTLQVDMVITLWLARLRGAHTVGGAKWVIISPLRKKLVALL